MALSMMDKSTDRAEKSAWPPAIAAEFERERQNNNGCVGTTLLSESDRVRVWIIRLAPGERIGFHRHVLDYFWTSVTGGAVASTSTTAAPSNIRTNLARPATKLTDRVSSRSMTLRTLATKRWSL
jgi:hypothetical protein